MFYCFASKNVKPLIDSQFTAISLQILNIYYEIMSFKLVWIYIDFALTYLGFLEIEIAIQNFLKKTNNKFV